MAELLKKLFPINLQLFNDDPPTDPPADPPADTDPPADPEQTFDARYVKGLRDEAAKYRTEKNKIEGQLKAIQKALGLDTTSDPDELQKQLTAKEQRIRALAIENTFSRVASKLGADADLTLAVLHRKGVLDTLDVDDANFASALEAEVKSALAANPKLKVESEPKKLGDNQGGGKGDGDPKPDMNSFIRRAAGRK